MIFFRGHQFPLMCFFSLFKAKTGYGHGHLDTAKP